jgi:hypothetical protein
LRISAAWGKATAFTLLLIIAGGAKLELTSTASRDSNVTDR